MEQWYVLEQIVYSTALTNDIGDMIWKYNAFGVYSASSLYKIINFEEIVSVYILAV